MGRRQFVVRCTPDLWRALRSREVITLRLPLIDSRLQAKAEKRFNFWQQVCGCQIGALLLVATLAWRLPDLVRTPEWSWTPFAFEVVIALLAALVGKGLAIAGARALLAADIALFLRRTRRGVLSALGS